MEDTKNLRKRMFICNNERENNLHQAKMRKLGWDKENPRLDDTRVPTDTPEVEAFSNYNRILQHDDILENVASHFSHQDLLTCRLVCKLWSIEMATYLTRRKSLTVVDDQCSAASKILQKRVQGDPIALTKLSLFDIFPGCNLYKKLFAVFGWTLCSLSLEECQLSVKDLKCVLLNYAPNLENFHFKEVESVDQKQSRKSKKSTFKQIKMLNNDNFSLPKLKMLHWDEVNGETELNDIIEACPNLVALEIRNFPLPKPTVLKNLTWNSLKSLFLSPRNVLSVEHCKGLASLQLKLEKLTLFGLNPRDKLAMKSLNKFLATLSETLIVLEMWLDYVSVIGNLDETSFSPFPVSLPNVLRLQTESEILGHIKNVSHLPALKELEIISNLHQRQNWCTLTKKSTIKSQETLQSFRCGDIDSKSLVKVMRTFPFMSSLYLYATHVDDLCLRAVIKNLPNLVDLTISTCMITRKLRLTDAGVTGVNKETCAKLVRNNDLLGRINIKDVQTKPGIGDLKFLQKLDFGLQISQLSDVSLILSIAKLEKLCSLKLPLSAITDASLKVIEDGFNSLVLLSISGCHKVSPEAIENLKTTRKSLIIENDLYQLHLL